MATARVIKAVNVLEYRALGLTACFPTVPPDQLSLNGFEERFDHGIVVTIALATHRDLEAMLGKTLLILVGTILRPAIRVVNAVLGRLSQCHGHVQCLDCQIPFHAITDSPADDAAGVQIKDDSQIEPALTGPDVADVSGPLLVGAIR